MTGAGRGIGYACAKRLAETLDVLLVCDIEERSVREAARKLSSGGRVVEAFVGDVANTTDIHRLAARASELGTLRAVANIAGISPTMGDWRRVMDVNLVAAAMITEVFRPLVNAGTAIIHTSSVIPWITPLPVDPAIDAALDSPLDVALHQRLTAAIGAAIEDPGVSYTWAKWGVIRLVRREAALLGARGGRICSVSPGTIDTPMMRDSARSADPLVSRTPLGRRGRAEEVAAAAAFLLSDEASFINGADLLVDGGLFGSYTAHQSQKARKSSACQALDPPGGNRRGARD